MPYADPERERERSRRRVGTPERKAYEKKYKPEYYKANRERVRLWHDAYKLRQPERYLYQVAKGRAKRRGIAFEIEISDIVIPAVCPILGIPLFMKKLATKNDVTPNSPSLDRIHPELGYVKGNIQVISWRANSIKRDATPEELRKVADYMCKQRDV